MSADLILHNAKIATNAVPSFVEAVAINSRKDNRGGNDDEILRLRGPQTRVIDGRRANRHPWAQRFAHASDPRWAQLQHGVALGWRPFARRRSAHAERSSRADSRAAMGTSCGGWTEFQFAERRMPTLDEINAVAPDTPVFVMHLYDRALLNGAALRAVGYDKNAPDFPAAKFSATATEILRAFLSPIPTPTSSTPLWPRAQSSPAKTSSNSSRLFFRELNRFGITSAIDAGGGFQNYPDDYGVVNELHRNGELSSGLPTTSSRKNQNKNSATSRAGPK